MSLWIFSITAILTLPKQLMAVYLGTVFGKEEAQGWSTSKIVEWIVLGISFLITIWAAWYIYSKMAKWRPIVLQEQAEKRAAADALESGNIPDLQSRVVATDTQHLPQDGGPGIIVTSPSSLSNRLSVHRWPFDGQAHGGPSSHGPSPTASRSEPHRQRESEEARSPLVGEASQPAGYGQSHYQRQSGPAPDLYQVNTNQTMDANESDEAYGYADGGESFTQRDSYTMGGQQQQLYDRRTSPQPSPRQSQQGMYRDPYSQGQPHQAPQPPYLSQRQQQQQQQHPRRQTQSGRPSQESQQSGYLSYDQPIRVVGSGRRAHGTHTPDAGQAPSSEVALQQDEEHLDIQSHQYPQVQAQSSYPGMAAPQPRHQNAAPSYRSMATSPAPTYQTAPMQQPPHAGAHPAQQYGQEQRRGSQDQYPPAGAPPRYHNAYR